MSAFPVFDITYGSRVRPLQERRILRDMEGNGRIRVFWSGKNQITLEIQGLTDADKATVEAHYAANQTQTFAIDWAGTGYTVAYGESPLDWTPEPTDRWTLKAVFEEM